MGVNDLLRKIGHHPYMPRKPAPPPSQPSHDWYLQEWLKTLRVSQAKLAKACGWSKATANDVYHGRTSYYRQILNEVASALHVQPFELLMHPEDAMAYRQMSQALRAVEHSPRITALSDEELPSVAAQGGR